MADAKHTPGPWNLYRGEDGEAIAVRQYVTGDNGGTVAKDVAKMPLPETRGPVNARTTRLEINANASLISAAPTLLEALRRLADQCEAEFTVDGMWSNDGQAISHVAYRDARAAIAKAEGRSNG